MNTALKWLAAVLATAIFMSLTAWAAITAIEAAAKQFREEMSEP